MLGFLAIVRSPISARPTWASTRLSKPLQRVCEPHPHRPFWHDCFHHPATPPQCGVSKSCRRFAI